MDVLAATRNSGRLGGLPDNHFIGGEWVKPAAGGTMETFDPGRAAPHARFAAGDAESDHPAELVALALPEGGTPVSR